MQFCSRWSSVYSSETTAKQCPDSNDWRACHHSTVFNYCAHIAWQIDCWMFWQRQRTEVFQQYSWKKKTRPPWNLVYICNAYANFSMVFSLAFFEGGSFYLLFSSVVVFHGETLPLHRVLLLFSPKRILKEVAKREPGCYQKHANTDFPQHLCTLCYLSFPFQFQLDTNPTREHKKWVKSYIYGQTSIQRGFWLQAKHWLTRVKCREILYGERGKQTAWLRERDRGETSFFFYFSPQLVLLRVA